MTSCLHAIRRREKGVHSKRFNRGQHGSDSAAYSQTDSPGDSIKPRESDIYTTASLVMWRRTNLRQLTSCCGSGDDMMTSSATDDVMRTGCHSNRDVMSRCETRFPYIPTQTLVVCPCKPTNALVVWTFPYCGVWVASGFIFRYLPYLQHFFKNCK